MCSVQGLEFGRYSIDYHYIRNYIYVKRAWKSQRAEQHIPEFAKRLVAMYNKDGAVSQRLQLKPGMSGAVAASQAATPSPALLLGAVTLAGLLLWQALRGQGLPV